jgi:hypothetical protein
VQLLAAVTPVAQRVARGRLDLDDIGAEIRELERKHVAGDEPRQVEHAHSVERSGRGGIERDAIGHWEAFVRCRAWRVVFKRAADTRRTH